MSGAEPGSSSRREDWVDWHRQYDDPAAPLARRREIVAAEVGSWLDAHPSVPITVLSICAGQGRELLPALARRGDADRIDARLVELDPDNARLARAAGAGLGLRRFEVREADAGALDAYRELPPADLLLACGVFGNVSLADIERTIAALPGLCGPGATVIWTRSRRDPDLTPEIRRLFAAAGLEEQAFHAPPDCLFSVGVHRLTAAATARTPDDGRLFTFLR